MFLDHLCQKYAKPWHPIVLFLRTLPNRNVNNMRLQSSSVFDRTIELVLDKMAAICLDFRSHLKFRPFATQPLLDHLKSRLGCISDPHCRVKARIQSYLGILWMGVMRSELSLSWTSGLDSWFERRVLKALFLFVQRSTFNYTKTKIS